MVDLITIEEYCEFVNELDARETILLAGRWPVTIGLHPDLGEVLLAHIGDRALLVRAPAVGAKGVSVPNLPADMAC
jgi:hypothetical protein